MQNEKSQKMIKMVPMPFLFAIFIIRSICGDRHFLTASAALTNPARPQMQYHQLTPLVSEGSLCDMQVSSTMANKPGSTPGFFNPKRRLGRDFVVLSVAHWLAAEAKRRSAAAEKKHRNDSGNTDDDKSFSYLRPVRLLDATCATGIQGLRTIVESPILAKAILAKIDDGHEHERIEIKDSNSEHDNIKPLEPPELQLVLNDIDADAIDISKQNVNSVQEQMYQGSGLDNSNTNISVTQRVAQAIMHEETFEISVLDPFGSVQPFLDAALARAPQGGLIEICATDVGVLYGTRPSIASRRYNAHLADKRPPCFRERGVRLLFAAIAQAAGRHDRGVEPLYGISTEHFCLVSMRVLRGAKAADATARQVGFVKICRRCGAAGISKGDSKQKRTQDSLVPSCGCNAVDGAGFSAEEEGPLWVGPLYDFDTVEQMAKIASLEEAKGIISEETCTFLLKLREEAAIKTWFYRRPGVAAGGKTPKLTTVMEELKRLGFNTARTHFCSNSLKTDASVQDFDDVVRTVL